MKSCDYSKHSDSARQNALQIRANYIPAKGEKEGLFLGVPVVAQWVENLTSIHEDVDLIPGPTLWMRDLALLWLWCRTAAAAPI